MKHPYLIDLNDKDNWLYPVEIFRPDGTKGEDQRTIHMGIGEHRTLCVTDSVMYPNKPGDIHCHEHQQGYEDFFVDSGGLNIIVNGKAAFVGPGNIIHLQPYEAHGMEFKYPTKYRGFFHDLKNSDNAPELALLREKRPDAAKDPDFFKFMTKNFDMAPREKPVYEEAPPEQVPAVRNINRPMMEFNLDGVTMKMITARWENGGICEMWAAEMEPGFHAEWVDMPAETEMYYVTKGRVKFTVYDEEFEATPECVVKIPKFAAHSLVALENSVVYDVAGTTRWQAFFQDRASILQYDPERAKKPETMEELKAKFGCQIKSCGLY